jgi:hypothetical protein
LTISHPWGKVAKNFVQNLEFSLIYVTHGALSNWSSQRISHALMLPEANFETHLRQRTEKYVTISQALMGCGDALTIDDASYAGFRAASLARCYGHSVTWFINGMNVEQNLQYFHSS